MGTSDSAIGCDVIQCLNNNICVSATNHSTSPAHCQCRGKWAGLRCEDTIQVKVHEVTSETAVLEISGEKTQTFSDLHIRELTLATWELKMNSSRRCMMQQTTASDDRSGLLSLKGLEKNQEYFFCVVNGHFDLCAYFRLGVADMMVEKNCLNLSTLSVDPPPDDDIVFLVVISLMSVLVVVVLVVFIYLHRQSLVWKMMLNYCCCRNCYSCRKRLSRLKQPKSGSGLGSADP